MSHGTTVTKLSELASDQWGLLTRRQAEEAGVSPATLQRLSDKAVLERVAWGVYRLTGAPEPDHMRLRAAWLQLAPETPAWERKPEQGVVSHRSAAAMFELGHLPADRHEFILPIRRQVRRPDVRLHRGQLRPGERTILGGLPVTWPARTAADLLADREDPQAVAQVVSDALRKKNEWAGNFASALSTQAGQLGLRRGDGLAALSWLLNLTGDPQAAQWMEQARSRPVELTSPLAPEG